MKTKKTPPTIYKYQMLIDKFVGKVLYVKLPTNKHLAWRWIVSKRPDGRYIVRTPKIGVKIRNLSLFMNQDYGPEKLLPLNSIIRPEGRHSKGYKKPRLLHPHTPEKLIQSKAK